MLLFTASYVRVFRRFTHTVHRWATVTRSKLFFGYAVRFQFKELSVCLCVCGYSGGAMPRRACSIAPCRFYEIR
jgi:hypothetical protein